MLLCFSLAAFAWHAYQVLPDGRPLPGSILFNFTPEEVRAAGDLYHKLNPKLSPVSSNPGQHQQMQQQVLHLLFLTLSVPSLSSLVRRAHK